MKLSLRGTANMAVLSWEGVNSDKKTCHPPITHAPLLSVIRNETEKTSEEKTHDRLCTSMITEM